MEEAMYQPQRRKYVKTENTPHHKGLSVSTCPRCGSTRPLTNDYFGDEMCSQCLLRSIH